MLDVSLERPVVRSVPVQRLYVGFLCVVIVPALFWSLVVFFVAHHEGSTLAPHASIVFFAVSAVFLNFICTALKVRT